MLALSFLNTVRLLLFHVLLCVFCVNLAAAHQQVGKPAGAQRVVALRIVPQEILLKGAQASHRLLALAKGADGIERDVTSEVSFRVLNASIARIEASGEVSALKDGSTTLIAQLAGLESKARVRVDDSQTPRTFSFARDIGGILTSQGCNNSVCHGGVKGKGGFKLSLDALHPSDDYKWITEGGAFQVLTEAAGGQKVPRIDLKSPEKSLLLLKATEAVPHGGGLRFAINSPSYSTLLNWVRSGAPFGEPDANPVTRIDVLPGDVVLSLGTEHRLIAIAHAAGSQQDVSSQVTYESSNPAVVQVSPDGVVHGVGKGEAAVTVRAPGHLSSIRVGVITEHLAKFPDVPSKNLIDEYVFAKLRKFNILPSSLATDEEFLRRVCLDLTGTLPPPIRTRDFLASRNKRKREQLIEVLLDSPEYDAFWTLRFSDLFRVGGSGGSDSDYAMYWRWVRQNVTLNRRYDQVARERIEAQGFDGPSRHYMYAAKFPPLETVISETTRVFLGRRIECAQCHNHPYDTWSQDQFWGLAAFYSKSTTTNWVSDQLMYDDRNGTEIDQGVDGIDTLRFFKTIHPRTKREVNPTFIDGTSPPSSERETPRRALAAWVVSHPWFAEAAINRMWAYFFGRGFVNPVDDFSSTNPPTHREMLTALAEYFRKQGFDLKQLFRLIVQSRTYQLSSVPNKNNQDDFINYSHALPRPLEADVLQDAIVTALGGWQNKNGERADPDAEIRSRAVFAKHPGSSRFLEVFGRGLRQTLPEFDGKPNLAQALHMLVGSTYTQEVVKDGARIDQLVDSGASNRAIIEELYMASLVRPPTAEELSQLEPRVSAHASRREAFQNLLWALISSREFAYNH